jgi:hypothetical protein
MHVIVIFGTCFKMQGFFLGVGGGRREGERVREACS